MSGSRLRPFLVSVVAAFTVVTLGASTAHAAIPSNGVYYACLTKSTGALKVINYPKVKCAKGQQLLKWSQQGPAGAQGVQGPAGPVGPSGPAGASGSSTWGDIANKPADLVDGQIGWGEVANKPADLVDGQIGWAEVANKPASFADGQIGWGEVANKPAGFADGADDGITSITLTVVSTSITVQANDTKSGTASCPAGSKAVGGGFNQPASYDLIITDSAPFGGTGWNVFAKNPTTGALPLNVWAVCMRTEPSGAITTSKIGVAKAKVKTLKAKGH